MSSVLAELSQLVGTADKAFDMKAYAIYLLTEGSMAEKRELLANLKSKLIMKNKTLSLEGAV